LVFDAKYLLVPISRDISARLEIRRGEEGIETHAAAHGDDNEDLFVVPRLLVTTTVQMAHSLTSSTSIGADWVCRCFWMILLLVGMSSTCQFGEDDVLEY
jgi:hypothetical protein